MLSGRCDASLGPAGLQTGQPLDRGLGSLPPTPGAQRRLRKPAPTLQHTASAPDLRKAIGVNYVAPKWVSTIGCGGYHFPAPEDDHEFGLHEGRHERSEALKWQQTRAMRAEQRSNPN